MEITLTQKGNSYYNQNGTYTTQLEDLYNTLVPSMGDAETTKGQLVRYINKLWHEYCNNGNCNARDIIDNYNYFDNEFDPYEIEIDKWYKEILNYIKYNTNLSKYKKEIQDNIKKIENIMLIENCQFSDQEQDAYNKLTDYVMYYIINEME